MGLSVRPITRNSANAWLARHHRHLRRALTGWLFGVEILNGEGARVGVAVAGRPSSRMLQDGLTVEITRVCTTGELNACSFAYGALRRAASALGYRRVVTYTRADELGTSPRAAGFRDDGLAGGGDASRPSRLRNASEDPSPKRRWVWP